MDAFFILIFFLISISHLFFCYKEYYKQRCITKVLLMPLLIITLMFATSTTSYLVMLALFFGFLGDLFLIFSENKKFFIYGLITFLIGHVFYVIELFERLNFNKLPSIAFPLTLIVIVVAIFLFKSLIEGLGNLKVPVILYACTIVSMLIFALLYFLQGSTTKTFITFIGAFLFVISDFTLATSLFKRSFKHESFYIMITYITAQFLLATSLV